MLFPKEELEENTIYYHPEGDGFREHYLLLHEEKLFIFWYNGAEWERKKRYKSEIPELKKRIINPIYLTSVLTNESQELREIAKEFLTKKEN